MFSMTSEAIIFAIHSAIRLSANLRKAYANSLNSKRIVLPFPAFNQNLEITTAQDFFSDQGAAFVTEIEDLARLHKIVKITSEDDMNPEDVADYLEYYKVYWQSLNGALGEISSEDLTACFRIRQWKKGKGTNIKPLQLVAGTLVNIGIDYFNQVPGALNPDSAAGKFLKSFFTGIDNLDFTQNNNFKRAIFRKVIPQLFVSSAETLSELSDGIGHDVKFQNFIKNASAGLAEDIHNRIAAMGTDGNQTEVIQWGRLVFKSLVKNSGEYVFTNPSATIGTGIKESELVKSVGNTLMSILLDEDPVSKVKFKDIFTMGGLDKVVKSTLSVVAEYPGLLTNKNADGTEKNAALKEIITNIASALATSGINRPGLLPDVIRLVMVNTAGNLERLTNAKDGKANHLLVTAFRDVLTVLAPKAGDEKWRPNFSNADLMDIVGDVFNEVVANPQWVESKVNANSLLGEVLSSTYNALEKIPESDRLNGKTLRVIIMLGMRTAANNSQVLGRIKWGDGQTESTYINKALDIVFACTFTKTTAVDKVSLVADLADYVLGNIIEKHPNAHGLVLTQLVLDAQANAITNNGFNKETANLLVQSALGVINEHPDLVTNNTAFQNIISGVSEAWEKMGIKQPHLLGELIRITLTNTAGNLDLLIPSQVGESKHLAVVALNELLSMLSQNVPTGKWKPRLTNADLLNLVNDLLDEVVHNPNWITDKVEGKQLFSQILDANFAALRNIPETQRLSGAVLQALVQLSLRTAAVNSKVLGLFKWGDGDTESTYLNKGLDLIFAFVFKDNSAGDKSTLLIELTDYILENILAKYPNEVGLTLILNILSDDLGIILTSGGIDKVKANDLIDAALGAIAEHPELVSNKEGIGNIVANTAKELRDSKLGLSEMLPEFIRLILDKTAGNLDLLIDSRKRKQKMVLILALQQVLKALSTRPASGKWKPTLTGTQILEITENIFEYIIQNPQWIKNDLVFDLLKTVLKSLENVPNRQPLAYEVVHTLIDHAFQAVNFRKQLILDLDDTGSGDQQLAIEYSLDGLFVALYDETGGEIGSWTLTQGPVLESIIEVFLARISGQIVTKAEIDAALDTVRKAVKDLNENGAFLLEVFLGELGGTA